MFVAVNRQQTNDWLVSSLPIPLNSPADDFGITFTRDAEQGFFSSNRDDARGYDHIFSFVYPETTILVTGFAVDQEDEFIMGAAVRVAGSDGSQQQFITNGKGEYQFKATGGTDYLLMATADGFLKQEKSLRTTSEEIDTLYYVDFEMIPYDKPVVLEHIFYDFNRAVLRPESKRELDNLVAILLDHPEISIELTAHTDRKGDEAYNLELSSKRAQAAAGYLMESGIEEKRVAAVGRGKRNRSV